MIIKNTNIVMSKLLYKSFLYGLTTVTNIKHNEREKYEQKTVQKLLIVFKG